MKYTKFGVHIKAQDIEASYNFYINLGFKPVFAYGNEKFLLRFGKDFPTASEKYNGVTFEVGDSFFEVASGHLAVKDEIFQETIQSSKTSAMLHVDSLDDVVNACREHSINIEVEPREFHWGTKELVVKDPDGFILVFIERLS